MTTLFATKVAVIRFHIQLTEGFAVQKFAKWMFWVLIVIWIAFYILFFSICPLEDRWEQPPKRCAAPTKAVDYVSLYSKLISSRSLPTGVQCRMLARVSCLASVGSLHLPYSDGYDSYV